MFIKKAITGVSYFKKLDGMIIEEIIYMLQTEHYDLGEVIIEPGKTINKLRFISDGEIEIMVWCNNGGEIILDTLTKGCNLGAYSILGIASQFFYTRAKSPVTCQVLNLETLTIARQSMKPLNNAIAEVENYINTYGVPICDYELF